MSAVSYSRRGLPVRPENIFPDMLPAGFGLILAQSVRFYHLFLSTSGRSISSVIPNYSRQLPEMYTKLPLCISAIRTDASILCNILKCSPDDLFEITPDNPSD